VGAGAITVNTGSGRQTFAIDGHTKVDARGARTLTPGRDGVTVPDLVAVGSRVTVSFHRIGETLHAAEIRVR
jgi:hypothetical protein